jgi:molybdopterin molybdotransferase
VTVQPSVATPGLETTKAAPTPAGPAPWEQARAVVYAAGAAVTRPTVPLPLGAADGTTLAEPLVTLTDLPAFATSSVDGWAVRGPAPWRMVGRVLAGAAAPPLTEDGTCVEIATGAMVPPGTEHVVRVEESTTGPDGVTGQPRAQHDWREPGEEAARGEELLPAGTPVTPGVIGLAASCGYDQLRVKPAPTAAVLVFGDELLTAGLPGDGRVRDALGQQMPAWLRRAGADPHLLKGPVEDTLDGHVAAIRAAVDAGAELICTTGGTMRGPVDHLHPALAALGGRYIVNTVAVRPGYPMLVAQLPGGQFLAGLPGNPQSAVVAFVSLVLPLLAGMQGRLRQPDQTVTLGVPIAGRGDFTHLALVREDPDDGLAYPLSHAASSMLRGLAQAVGFAVVAPRTQGEPGARLPCVPLPLLPWERP